MSHLSRRPGADVPGIGRAYRCRDCGYDLLVAPRVQRPKCEDCWHIDNALNQTSRQRRAERAASRAHHAAWRADRLINGYQLLGVLQQSESLDCDNDAVDVPDLPWTGGIWNRCRTCGSVGTEGGRCCQPDRRFATLADRPTTLYLLGWVRPHERFVKIGITRFNRVNDHVNDGAHIIDQVKTQHRHAYAAEQGIKSHYRSWQVRPRTALARAGDSECFDWRLRDQIDLRAWLRWARRSCREPA